MMGNNVLRPGDIKAKLYELFRIPRILRILRDYKALVVIAYMPAFYITTLYHNIVMFAVSLICFLTAWTLAYVLSEL